MASNPLLRLLIFVEMEAGVQPRPLLSTDASSTRDHGRVISPQLLTSTDILRVC
jgi:hypothetical protein